jgi:hypothetical protein
MDSSAQEQQGAGPVFLFVGNKVSEPASFTRHPIYKDDCSFFVLNKVNQ